MNEDQQAQTETQAVKLPWPALDGPREELMSWMRAEYDRYKDEKKAPGGVYSCWTQDLDNEYGTDELDELDI